MHSSTVSIRGTGVFKSLVVVVVTRIAAADFATISARGSTEVTQDCHFFLLRHNK